MLVEAYILCWNEEKILPFTLEHYSSFCDTIHLLDNYSSDNSLKIAEEFPKVRVTQWACPEGPEVYDERCNIMIKNCSYEDMGAGADWVFIVDCDELVYHPEMRKKLEEYMYAGVTLPKTEGYNMFSKKFPNLGTPLTEQIKEGIPDPSMGKRLVFDPRIGLKYACGSHISSVERGFNIVRDNKRLPYTSSLIPEENPTAEIKILHYKDLSPEYKINRLKELSARMSDWCLDTDTSVHWLQTEEKIKEHFETVEKKVEVVI